MAVWEDTLLPMLTYFGRPTPEAGHDRAGSGCSWRLVTRAIGQEVPFRTWHGHRCDVPRRQEDRLGWVFRREYAT